MNKMRKTAGRKGKLEYKERTKIKLTNKREQIKAKKEIVKRAKGKEESWGWRAAMIQQLIPIGILALKNLLEDEVESLVGKWYERGGKGNRWGSNPGSVYLGDQKVSVEVPRVRKKSGKGEIVLESYKALRNSRQVDELALKRVILGLSQRNYKKAVIEAPETFGIAKSSISRKFIRASVRKLREFMDRDLSVHDIIAIVMDGKSFGENQIVIAMGVTLEGEKVLLGFVETGTENHTVCREFLRRLIDRGLKTDQEILFVIDGAKGLRKGIVDVFGEKAFIQRCQWHKRENVIGYLGKSDGDYYRQKMQAAYEQPAYQKAKSRLSAIGRELEKINGSAVQSLEEGLEETLTLHKLKLFSELGISFKTTNMLENVNSLLEITTGRVNYWKNSDHRQRWIATALLEIEPRLRPVKGCRFLPALRSAMRKERTLKQFKHLENVA